MPRHPSTSAFAATLELLRSQRGLSYSDLARGLNVSVSQVTRWCHGEVTPSIDSIADIARYFQFDRETLERLAGYRANTVERVQDSSIDPVIAAMFDAELAETHEALRDIPKPFHRVVLEARRWAREAAVKNARAMIKISQGETPELAPPPDELRNLDERYAPGSKDGLTPAYALVATH